MNAENDPDYEVRQLLKQAADLYQPKHKGLGEDDCLEWFLELAHQEYYSARGS